MISKFHLYIIVTLIIFNSCRKSRVNNTYEMKFYSVNTTQSNFKFNLGIKEYNRNTLYVSNLSSYRISYSRFVIHKKKLTGKLIEYSYSLPSSTKIDTFYYDLIGNTSSKKIWGNYTQILPTNSSFEPNKGTFEMDLTKPLE